VGITSPNPHTRTDPPPNFVNIQCSTFLTVCFS